MLIVAPGRVAFSAAHAQPGSTPFPFQRLATFPALPKFSLPLLIPFLLPLLMLSLFPLGHVLELLARRLA